MNVNTGRSVLWSLPPIGIGTPDAESAQSCLWRLASTHGLAELTLHKFINGRGPAIYVDRQGCCGDLLCHEHSHHYTYGQPLQVLGLVLPSFIVGRSQLCHDPSQGGSAVLATGLRACQGCGANSRSSQ